MSRKVSGQEKKQRVLIVDDTPANVEVLHRILRGDYALFFAGNGANAIKVAQRERPDLILLDVMMPDVDGYQVCAALKSDERTRDIPVIFITAMESVENEARGLDCGAIDYLTKPISPPIVKARVRNHLESKRKSDVLEALTAELREKNRQLAVLAREDGLTGVANRRCFNTVLEAEINRAIRTGQCLSLIMCDVDHFKRYNDHFGHPAGDRCLAIIGELLRTTFRRAGDLPARYGGEEFAVILPDTSPGQAFHLAEKFREELIRRAIPHAESEVSGVVTTSIGVAGGVPAREQDAQWLVTEADRALYLAKERGRNRTMMADPASPR
ncbi:diguanylate cyclase [Geomonas sp. Red32]|uniref:diguanylate cyclase n=1 Tax=Geomonas sp. Red32 TaxID=2912856 RepID=UPI00202CFCC9|nr:diguanylate cyclase [Geomonas sp. Red32]MCM0082574.1 diguanylate cyclase [Geomonas sp. Red32]